MVHGDHERGRMASNGERRTHDDELEASQEPEILEAEAACKARFEELLAEGRDFFAEISHDAGGRAVAKVWVEEDL
jgi:hypothetical protein